MKPLLNFSIILFFLSIILGSCNQTPKEAKTTPQIQQVDNSLYGNQKFIFPELSGTAKLEVTHWGAYEDFEDEVKALNGSTIEALQIKTSQLVSHLDSLTKKIPDTLNTQAIFSRLLVVKTRTSLLDQELNKSRIDSIQLQDYIDEMNISVKNLIIQINEKFEKDAIDLQKNRK